VPAGVLDGYNSLGSFMLLIQHHHHKLPLKRPIANRVGNARFCYFYLQWGDKKKKEEIAISFVQCSIAIFSIAANALAEIYEILPAN